MDSAHLQRGSGLLELMITLFIFGLSLLGLADLQALSFRAQRQGTLKTLAVQEAHNILLEHQILGNDPYFSSLLSEWQTQVHFVLPDSHADFTSQALGYHLQLFWQPQALTIGMGENRSFKEDALDYENAGV